MPERYEAKSMHWSDVGIRRESCLCVKDLLSEILVTEKTPTLSNFRPAEVGRDFVSISVKESDMKTVLKQSKFFCTFSFSSPACSFYWKEQYC